MREFILRARKAPSSGDFVLEDLRRFGFLEIIAHCICNALFYACHIRPQTIIHLVLEGPSAPPKTVRLVSDELGSLGGYDERSIWSVLQRTLVAGSDLVLDEEIQVGEGLYVAKRSFERLVRYKGEAGHLYHVHPRGSDIRQVELSQSGTFVLTDHLSMPKKSDHFLQRLGARPISVGPRTLFASHCVVLVHNELDRQEAQSNLDGGIFPSVPGSLD